MGQFTRLKRGLFFKLKNNPLFLSIFKKYDSFVFQYKDTMSKKRIVKDYADLPTDVLNEIKLEYPYGFSDNLISYTSSEGKTVSALLYETDEFYYLVRMTKQEAIDIIEDDDDYDEDGNLTEEFIDEYSGDGEEDEDSPSDDEDDD